MSCVVRNPQHASASWMRRIGAAAWERKRVCHCAERRQRVIVGLEEEEEEEEVIRGVVKRVARMVVRVNWRVCRA